MEERVKNPVLSRAAMRRRRSERSARRRNAALKGVGVEVSRQIRRPIRNPRVWSAPRGNPTEAVTILPRKSAKLLMRGSPVP
jgi:hypothetical protein